MVNSYLYLYTVCSVTHAALTVILNLSENIPFITDVYLTATWTEYMYRGHSGGSCP